MQREQVTQLSRSSKATQCPYKGEVMNLQAPLIIHFFVVVEDMKAKKKTTKS